MKPLRITDPYAVPGRYRKAQLHCHTTNSDGTHSPRQLAERYRTAGYTFVVFTDHGRVTACEDLNDGAFLALPGVETAIGRPFGPLGPHLGRLGAPGPLHVRGAQPCIDATVAAGGVVSLHHPGWTGNLWTGGWSVAEMVRLRGYHLIEVSNHHSHSPADVQRWAAVLARRGPVAPVGAAAVDDLHRDRDFNTGWVMVKTEAVTGEAFLRALRGLAVYASTGPSAEFVARDGAIRCATDAVQVRFIDARGATRYLGTGPEAVYEPQGDEGFVRVECAGRSGGSAWSQAFWVSGPGDPPGLRLPEEQSIISP
ncbi:MAG: hypothetical protein E6H00_13655 [Bacillati bacterium ANGP1]|uniref:Polymerase/histidinol phosphatase N-terminal domain-containing protein n=1 Tax=Candidatus Segetimicrobium genomatis TaxID=2569760 RepID=A0A537JXA0_9BACT|nr:MAG: hypothetical protein E6H00_13655 [Terrabacteria group bacterium ANGP1]